MGGLFVARRARRRIALALIVLSAITAHSLAISVFADVERYVFYLSATPNRSLDNLCVGDVVRIDVAANRLHANSATIDPQTTNPPVQVYGVTIEGNVGNPEVGSLYFTKRITSARGTPPGSAQFTFTATKAGTTGIVFKGTHIQKGWFMRMVSADKSYLSTELELTVRDCEYSVTATGHWHGFNLDYSAIVSDVRMSTSGGGHYTGAGIWTFLITATIGCANTQVYEAPITLTGDMEGDRLSVEIEYDPPAGNWIYHPTYDCSIDHATETVTQVADQVTVEVPADGGSLSVPQTLLDRLSGMGNLEGQARVTVTPVAAE